nr:hypothetical protein [Tanacetum cinerariifolium]
GSKDPCNCETSINSSTFERLLHEGNAVISSNTEVAAMQYNAPVSLQEIVKIGVVSQCSLLYVRSFITVKDIVGKFKDLKSDLEVASSAVTLVDGAHSIRR